MMRVSSRCARWRYIDTGERLVVVHTHMQVAALKCQDTKAPLSALASRHSNSPAWRHARGGGDEGGFLRLIVGRCMAPNATPLPGHTTWLMDLLCASLLALLHTERKKSPLAGTCV
jgi:hypothetical protein